MINEIKKEHPHPIDIHVGRRLRSRRIMLGISQQEIGDQVSITFQQIQKYECGKNRIGSSRLWEFSQILGVNIGYFYEEIEGAENTPEINLELTKEVLTLVRSYNGITNRKLQKKLLSLIRSLSSSPANDDKGVYDVQE